MGATKPSTVVRFCQACGQTSSPDGARALVTTVRSRCAGDQVSSRGNCGDARNSADAGGAAGLAQRIARRSAAAISRSALTHETADTPMNLASTCHIPERDERMVALAIVMRPSTWRQRSPNEVRTAILAGDARHGKRRRWSRQCRSTARSASATKHAAQIQPTPAAMHKTAAHAAMAMKVLTPSRRL